MLQIQDLHYSIGDRELLAGVNWLIRPGKRAALIGPNGAGKTTLLRILNEELEAHSGTVSKPKEYRIGYLPQEEVAMLDQSILRVVLEGQTEVRELEKLMARLHEMLDEPSANRESILNQLDQAEHRFQVLGGYRVEAEARVVLCGLGFSRDDLDRPISEFSGGWRMRVHLAILLVRQPDLLLLDEPTNHLDIPSLEWLEQYLLGFKGSIVAVSHDRFFIDRLAQEIVELDRGKMIQYAGNYHFYEREKELRESLLLKKWKEQQAERERQELFIRRFRYKATKAAQVQSRIKMLEKMEDIDIAPPPPRLSFTVKVETPSYKDVLSVKGMWFRYEESWVLKNIDLDIQRGDRICLIGANGAGKTTFTKLMAGQLTPQKGSLMLGERVKMGYYAQHQVEALSLDATILEEIGSTASTAMGARLRDILGIFQFRGDDVHKKIRVLSGGEKARVSLAKILISPVNFLVMDEPTNHLDKTAKEALEHALLNYDGTLILISHDRYFLDKLVSRVAELKHGELAEYTGNYTYYLERRDEISRLRAEQQKTEFRSAPESEKSTKDADASENADKTDDDTKDGKGKKTKEQKRLEAEARQAVSKELNTWKKRVQGLEDAIAALEQEKVSLEERLALPESYGDSQQAVSMQKNYARVTRELERNSTEWEKAQLMLDELSARARLTAPPLK